MTSASRHRSPRPCGPRRRRLVLAVVAFVVLAAGGAGQAYWTASSSGSYAKAQASTLTAPTVTASSVSATSATLSWTRPFVPTAYALTQSSGSLAGCSATPGAGSSGCTVTGLTPNTAYTWTLTASLSNWSASGAVTATTSRQSTTTTLSNLSPTSASQGTTFSATATVAGYGTPAGTVVFSLFSSATCSGAAAYTSSALTLSGGAVTGSFQPAAGTYYWRATYTPTDSRNLTSTSDCNAAVTVTAPTSSILFNYFNISLADYVSSRPTAFEAGQSIQNSGGSVLRTLTSITVTGSYPDTRVSGSAPLAVTGAGWSFQGSAHVGSSWVYTFTWTGSLPAYSSTSNLVYKIGLTDNAPGSATVVATASNPFTNTATWTLSGSF